MTNFVHAAAGAVIFRGLRQWSGSTLRIELPDGSWRDFGPRDAPRRVLVRVHHPRFFTRMLLGGTTGAGEA